MATPIRKPKDRVLLVVYGQLGFEEFDTHRVRGALEKDGRFGTHVPGTHDISMYLRDSRVDNLGIRSIRARGWSRNLTFYKFNALMKAFYENAVKTGAWKVTEMN